MNIRHLPSVARRGASAAALAAVAVLAAAIPAAAHVGVSASTARALATNVTLTFTSEAESDSAGFSKILVVLPDGISNKDVHLKDAPKGWKLTPDAQGYTVSGPALPVGTEAEHSVEVRQLPNTASLPFKTVETYSDGSVARWIEVPQAGKAEPENPAPVLKLKAAPAGADAHGGQQKAGARPSDWPSESPWPDQEKAAANRSTPAAHAEQAGGDGMSGGAIAAIVAAAVLVLVGAALWIKRRGSGRSA